MTAPRLAARAGVRQIEASLKADAAAAHAERAVGRVWRSLWKALRGVTSPWEASRLARRAGELLLQHPRAETALALKRVALWGHRTAKSDLTRTLSPAHLRAAVLLRGRPLTEAVTIGPGWADDLAAPLREPARFEMDDDEQRRMLADLLFRTPSEDLLRSIVYGTYQGTAWEQRLAGATRFASPDALASTVLSGFSAGKSQREIAADLLPVVDGVRSSARRIARTESMRVAHEVQHQAHEQLGDLVAGWQIHATLDENTRPEHASRSGTIYWKRPGPGQKGLAEMPRPPLEADGSISWNCRCYLSVVLRAPTETPPEATAVFETNAGKVVPDPLIYSEWFGRADERRRAVAVGAGRYAEMVRRLDGQAAEWEHFLDPETGELVGRDRLRAETPTQRSERAAKVRALIAERRRLLRIAAIMGWAE